MIRDRVSVCIISIEQEIEERFSDKRIKNNCRNASYYGVENVLEKENASRSGGIHSKASQSSDK